LDPKQPTVTKRQEKCNTVKLFKPIHVAKAIVAKLEELRDVTTDVYLAAPYPEEGFVLQLGQLLRSKNVSFNRG